MDVREVHHVAMAVEDLDEAVATYERLFGAEVEHRGMLVGEGIEAVYLRVGSDRLELVAPIEQDSTVRRFLDRRGPGMHHIAFAVPDVSAAIHALELGGATMVDVQPRPGLGGHEVAFVHPESVHGVLVEVVAGA